MVQNQKVPLKDSPEYKKWRSKRNLFRHSKNISYRTIHKKGRIVPSYSVCALCGIPLTQYNISNDNYTIIKSCEFLTTGSIVNCHICSSPIECYENKLRKEAENGNI